MVYLSCFCGTIILYVLKLYLKLEISRVLCLPQRVMKKYFLNDFGEGVFDTDLHSNEFTDKGSTLTK